MSCIHVICGSKCPSSFYGPYLKIRKEFLAISLHFWILHVIIWRISFCLRDPRRARAIHLKYPVYFVIPRITLKYPAARVKTSIFLINLRSFCKKWEHSVFANSSNKMIRRTPTNKTTKNQNKTAKLSLINFLILLTRS